MTANDPVVHEIPASELKAMLDRGETFELVDVRTPMERSIATIEGSRLLDQESYDELIRMDENTKIVFQCHHGERSRAAAHHFAQRGFTDICNVSDGIDGWSLSVDPTVRRY